MVIVDSRTLGRRATLPAVCIEETINASVLKIVSINYLSIRDLDRATFQVCRVGAVGAGA
jgi:hypothetical protein